MRINIPTNPDKLIKLAQKILAKHAADGASSPLGGIKGVASTAGVTAIADTNNALSTDPYRQAEKATQDRGKALGDNATTEGTVRYFVTSARDVLLGLNKGHEQALGDWGFDVTNSPGSGAGGATPPPAPTK